MPSLSPLANPESLSPEVEPVVAELLAEATPGTPVVFDADGTLWSGDVGEDLLRLLCARGALPKFPNSADVYPEYERRLRADAVDACEFAVQVMEGMLVSDLQPLCIESQRDLRGRVFPFVRPLFERLRKSGISIWIVSGSPVWSVCVAVAELGVPAHQVIATESRIEDGRLTGELLRPIPCGAGKVAGLKRHNVRPALAVGNGDPDLPMLAFAARALVVAPEGFQNELVRAAGQRGWPIQRVGEGM